MKVVINQCYGGFGLSPKAIHWIATKKQRPCYFFEHRRVKGGSVYTPIAGYPTGSTFWVAFDVSVPPEDKDYAKHALPYTYDSTNRHDPILVQVVEELGEAANGDYAELKIVDIPDGTDYVIQEYDGMEHVAEAHRTWN